MSELTGRRVEGIVARVATLVLSYLSLPVLAALRCERDVLQHQRAVILCGHPWDGSGRSLRLSKAWVPSPSASKKTGRSAAHGASAEVAPALPMLTWYPASIGGGGVGSPARGVCACELAHLRRHECLAHSITSLERQEQAQVPHTARGGPTWTILAGLDGQENSFLLNKLGYF